MKRIWILLLLLPLLAGCHKPETQEQEKEKTPEETKPEETTPPETSKPVYYVNMFGYNVMNVYYLWNSEIASGLASWKTDEDPIEKVRAVRYKDSVGNDIDRWTMMTDDFKSFTSSVAGVNTTVGMEFTL